MPFMHIRCLCAFLTLVRECALSGMFSQWNARSETLGFYHIHQSDIQSVECSVDPTGWLLSL